MTTYFFPTNYLAYTEIIQMNNKAIKRKMPFTYPTWVVSFAGPNTKTPSHNILNTTIEQGT